ncbi:hypothetical protein RIF25_16600 [Thermosynechococcaceae cyanobacterium BACA0444]|uniref:Uncharacterized protein n=1 Tax=Pseudocalidococcus azoricus BACA0444 TaxID=2918990 RepID=A0AAE4FV37_9CYAN|nr:hypothetical protein [Pseudocalidococcus azoricus]MDS3862418.1 hypothetical protein [Pseudocalidococcus azoricus BACA0444]
MNTMNLWMQQNDQQVIYDHLLGCVQTETPQQVIERFRTLFLMGYNYPDREIQLVLDQIVASPQGQQTFKLFFNRCCHILINRWQSRPFLQAAVQDFLAMLSTPIMVPAPGLSRADAVRRLRQLVKSYIQSEYFQKLRRLIEFYCEDTLDVREVRRHTERPLVTLIRRYPYLYDHCLLSQGNTPEEKEYIRKSQQETQGLFERDISKYLTTEFRRSQGSLVQLQPNPTLLTEQELKTALRHYVGKPNGKNTFRQQALALQSRVITSNAPQNFQQDFHQYLTDIPGLDQRNSRFGQRLQQYLTTLPSLQQAPAMNEFLLVRTCCQALNYLVVEHPDRPNHAVFMDLLNTIGTTATVGLLLKIILICKKARTHLEQRLAILFNHYQSFQRQQVDWLINCLEHTNLALTLHFGTRDFSLFSSI